jgi:DNA-binding winged helix-turn-helix (wHTH) protein
MQVVEHFTGRNSILCPCCHQPVEGAKFLADPITGMITNGSRSVRLTSQQMRLARHLFDVFPNMSTNERIYDQVFLDDNGQGPEINIIKVRISQLRPMLAQIGLAIQTVWGQGYKVVEAEPGMANSIKDESIRTRAKGVMHRWSDDDEQRLIGMMEQKISATVCATLMKLPYAAVTRAYKRLQSAHEAA